MPNIDGRQPNVPAVFEPKLVLPKGFVAAVDVPANPVLVVVVAPKPMDTADSCQVTSRRDGSRQAETRSRVSPSLSIASRMYLELTSF